MAYRINITPSDITPIPSAAFKSLRVGIASYRDWLVNELTDIQDVLSSAAISADQGTTASADDSSIAISIPNDDEVNVLWQLRQSDLATALNGSSNEVVVRTLNAHKQEIVSTFNYEEIASCLSQRIADLQGTIVTLDAALVSGLNTQFNNADLIAALQARGWQMCDYISNVAQMAAGSNWIDVIKSVISSGNKVENSSYLYAFEASQYSSTSGLELGLNAIATDVVEFFDSIDIDWSSLKAVFTSLWEGIVGVFGLLLKFLVPDLLNDYQVMSQYNLEAFDIPWAHVEYELSSANTLAYYVENAIDNAIRMGHADDIPSLSPIVLHGSDSSTEANVALLPTLDGFESVLAKKIQVGHCITVPTGFGFYHISRRDARVFDIYAFYGAFNITNAMVQADCTFSTKPDGFDMISKAMSETYDPGFKYLSVPSSAGSSQPYINAIYSYEGLNDKSRFNATFYGCGLFDCRGINSSVNVSAPGDWLTRWESSLNPEADLETYLIASAMSTLALCFSRDYDIQFTSVGGMITHSPSSVYSDLSLCDLTINDPDGLGFTSYYPYSKDTSPTFQLHAQTDGERAAEVRTALGNIAKAALAVCAATVAWKVRKKVRKASLNAAIKKRGLEQSLINKTHLGATISADDYKEWVGATRKANFLKGLSGVTLGSSSVEIISDALTNGLKDQVSEFEVIIRTITG